jgi:hypothetical protein
VRATVARAGAQRRRARPRPVRRWPKGGRAGPTPPHRPAVLLAIALTCADTAAAGSASSDGQVLRYRGYPAEADSVSLLLQQTPPGGGPPSFVVGFPQNADTGPGCNHAPAGLFVIVCPLRPRLPTRSLRYLLSLGDGSDSVDAG